MRGFGEQALAARDGALELPKSDVDHSRSAPRNSRGGPVPVSIGRGRPDKACETSPLAGVRRRRERLAPASLTLNPDGSFRPCYRRS